MSSLCMKIDCQYFKNCRYSDLRFIVSYTFEFSLKIVYINRFNE